jgi:hypothetical protein
VGLLPRAAALVQPLRASVHTWPLRAGACALAAHAFAARALMARALAARALAARALAACK